MFAWTPRIMMVTLLPILLFAAATSGGEMATPDVDRSDVETAVASEPEPAAPAPAPSPHR